MDRKEVKYLEQTACEIRRDVIHMGPRSGNVPHIGPALSCTDIITALYFNIMDVDPKNPHWEDRDRFVISKGHACLSLYAALAKKDYFPTEELWKVKQCNAMLQGHPDMKKIPGIDATSGSLGNGLSFALGIAMAVKYQQKNSRVYALLGDGDSQEGMIWEAAMLAGSRRVDNLVAVLDYNHLQGSGSTDQILSMEPLADKWRSFNWNVMEANGHSMEDLVNKLEIAKHYHGRPTIIIAHTVKGKGVSFMENNNAWHARPLTDDEYAQAIRELDEKLAQIAQES